MARRLSADVSAMRESVFAELAPRIEAFASRGGVLVPLHIGDTCLAPPPAARFGADDNEYYRYGVLGGDGALRKACAARLRATKRGPVDCAEHHVLMTAGATHGLFCTARALLNSGDEIVVLSPYWPLSVGVFRAAGAVPVEVPLPEAPAPCPLGGTVAPSLAQELLARVQAALTPRSRAIYFITPNNPDGRVLTRNELDALAEVAEANDLWVFADEVYADYVYDGEHVSFASLEGMANRTVTLFSFSKSHALAGARVGYVVADVEVIVAAKKIATHTVFNVPLVAQRAALRALETGDAWVDDARAAYASARHVAAEALTSFEIPFAPANGGSYLFADFARLLDGALPRALFETFIDHGVIVAPGDAFGAGYATRARICFTSVAPPALADGLARIGRAIRAFARL